MYNKNIKLRFLDEMWSFQRSPIYTGFTAWLAVLGFWKQHLYPTTIMIRTSHYMDT